MLLGRARLASLVEREVDSSECEKTEGLVRTNGMIPPFSKKTAPLSALRPSPCKHGCCACQSGAAIAPWDHPRSMGDACFPAGYALHVGGRGMEQIELVEKKVANANPSGAPAPPPFQQGRQIVLHVAGRGMEQIKLVERKWRMPPYGTEWHKNPRQAACRGTEILNNTSRSKRKCRTAPNATGVWLFP